MTAFRFLLDLICVVSLSFAFQSTNSFRVNKHQSISKTNLYDVPLELTGRLDPTRKWDVTLEFNGVTKVVSVSEGTSILDIAESTFEGEYFRVKAG
jgi:hypothetical protein